ncbi:DUF1822 family protein [Nostoc sp. FACHB-280]|uniref:DUF1822 family protein n=1 Tax=Nostoc sp. FACHB-280 TaxID=2692839 RepID=UPI00168BD403|nr:DUF1822 family protein [Nostoc sp. FACHB-280]MBD2495822.1 DUF1822 family protein [Nostoc sp. FACHB-280]
MKNITTNEFQERLDFEVLPSAVINLTNEQIAHAVEISNKTKKLSKQWQIYIHALALLAFEEWLTERLDILTINHEKSTLMQPGLASAITAVANLQVNKFKLCLLATGSLTDNQIIIPRVVIDVAEYTAHFYVLVEVLEEQNAVIISGFLTYQQLKEYKVKVHLQPTSDWNYQIPTSLFINEPDRLLLYLRYLQPEAIALPSLNVSTQMLANIQNELLTLLPQLESPESELWQILSWEQGKAVITHLELVNWVDSLQQKSHKYSTKDSLKDLLNLLTQPALNAGLWLWDELDELAQELSWHLLPNLTPAPAMRSPTEEFQSIMTQLQQRHIEIPVQARGAYQDFLLTGVPLRLYAVTWHLLSESEPHLWTLLLILGTASHQNLPGDLKLRVSDQTGILLETGVSRQQGDAYLFTRVVGNWNEKFLVSISLMDGIEVILPPFTFCPQRVL